MRANRTAITDFREARGLTKTELATKSGITSAYLHQIEEGLRNPSPRVIRSIADALKVNVTSVLTSPNDDDDDPEAAA